MAIISSRPSLRLAQARWRLKRPRTLAERAGVIGASVWKFALEIFKHMEKEGFRFGSDRLVTDVLAELIAFQVQLVDRAAYGRLAEAERAELVGEAVRHLAHTMENNQRDLLGPGEYRKPFIDLLNARFQDYAGFEYANDEPGYACLRYFAAKVADAMASGDNKWVLEQVMEIEAPEMVRALRKLIETTLPPGPAAPPPEPG